MNFSSSLHNFQLPLRSWGQWAQYHIQALSHHMHSDQTTAVAVFAIANSSLFLFQTLTSEVLENALWQDSEKKNVKGVTYQSLLFHCALMGASSLAFNILLSRLTKFSLNAWMLTAITVCAITTRFFSLAFKGIYRDEEMPMFGGILNHYQDTPEDMEYLWSPKAKHEEKKFKGEREVDENVLTIPHKPQQPLLKEKTPPPKKPDPIEAPEVAKESPRKQMHSPMDDEEYARILQEQFFQEELEDEEFAKKLQEEFDELAKKQIKTPIHTPKPPVDSIPSLSPVKNPEKLQKVDEEANKKDEKKIDEKINKDREEKSSGKVEEQTEAKIEAQAHTETKRLIEKLESYPIDAELKLLARSIINGEEQAPFAQLKNYWDTKCVKCLKNRHEFAQLFGSDTCDRYQSVRRVFAPFVYQKRPLQKELQWLSPAEIQKALQKTLFNDIDKSNCKLFGTGYYYHSTNIEGLEGILKSGQLEVRAKAFKGAFVSTSPFVFDHPYVLVFKKAIEHLSTLFHGFLTSEYNKDYWAGFSHHIPINEKTLAHILVKKLHGVKSESELELLCEKWTKRKIKVIGELEYCSKWKPKIDALGLGIPSHWVNPIHQDHVQTEKVEIVNIE